MRLRTVLLSILACCALAACTRPARASTTPTEAAALAAAEQDHTAYTLPPAKLAKATELYRIRVTTFIVGTLWGFLVLILILELGIAARLRDLATRLGSNRWTHGLIFLFAFLGLTTLLDLPLDLYVQHTQLAYGLSVQPWSGWLSDQGKSFLLTYGVGCLGVLVLFWLIRKSPRMWWLWLACTAMAFTVVGVFLTPYVVDPLFNTFEPLAKTNPELVEQLERVVAKGNGIVIPPDRMFLMKASDKTTTLNAYVTGFGASKRVVVWDTSIAKGTPDEILLIFGHEMGHYVLGHIVQGILLSFALILVGIFVGFHLFQLLLRRFGPRWRITAQDDWAATAIFVLVLSVLSFFVEPVANAFSRADEHAADVYGMEVVHGIVADPQATGQASFQLLGENSYSYPYPSPLLQFWTGSHPPIWLRAAFAKRYNPWAPGESPKYFKK